MFTDNMKHLLNFFLIMLITFSQAKKVKFSVDMNGQEVNNNGIHVSGDFQVAAGYPSNWDAQSTPMLKEGNTEIYSVIVNIPAFKKYEYKFVNGDQFYEVEIVPEKSRVGFEFIDNRWFYLDSLNNDTTILPAFLFGANAPYSKLLLRFKVDMKNQTIIDNKGVHVVGNFNNWQYNNAYMYSFDSNIYEYITYVDFFSEIDYRFINGNSQSKIEIIDGNCKNQLGNRSLIASFDTIINIVCFQKCTSCQTAYDDGKLNTSKIKLYPNPVNDDFIINFNEFVSKTNISIFDFTGRKAFEIIDFEGSNAYISCKNFKQGVYNVKINKLSEINNSFFILLENK